MRRSLWNCGDFNIAHEPIDLARPKLNEQNTGFLARGWRSLDRFVAAGYVDTFRKKCTGTCRISTVVVLSHGAPARRTWDGESIGFFVSDELEGTSLMPASRAA